MWKIKVQSPFGEGAVTMYADLVDFAHMPLVCINGIKNGSMCGAIVLPTDRKVGELSCLDPLYVPYTSLVYAGVVTDPGELLRFDRKLVLKNAQGESGDVS